MKSKSRSAVEMTRGWKVRKTKNRFPTLPTALGNRCRDSHIPTAPTGSLFKSKTNPKGVLRVPSTHLSSGSFFDEKMLDTPIERSARERIKSRSCPSL
jgi:hypothetical protein